MYHAFSLTHHYQNDPIGVSIEPCLNLHHTRHPQKRDKELDGSPVPKSMFLGFGEEGGGGGVADGEICFSTSHVTQHGQASKTALDAPWL